MTIHLPDERLSESLAGLLVPLQQLLSDRVGQRPTLGQPIEDPQGELDADLDRFFPFGARGKGVRGRMDDHAHPEGRDEKGAVPLHLRREGDEAGKRIGGPHQLLGPRIQSMGECRLLRPSLPLRERVPAMRRGSSQVRTGPIQTDHPAGIRLVEILIGEGG